MNRQSIGEHIREERQRLGLTQTEFGKMIDISKQALSSWENGISAPDIFMLKTIATVCGRSMDFFAEDKEKANGNCVIAEKQEPFGELTETERLAILKARTLTPEKRQAIEVLLGIGKTKK